MKSVISGLILVLAAIPVHSQITITVNEVTARLTVGNSLINRNDTLTTTADIGTPGSTANNWNFSALNTHSLDTLFSVTPATTPFVAFFPGATHALQTRQTIEGITGTVYQYLKLGTNLLNPGNAGSGQTPLGEAVLRTTNTPNDIFYQLPLSLGVTWTSTYVETLVVTILGFPFINQTTNNSITNTVDAHGTLTLPGGFGTYQALRIRSDNRSSNGRSISYQFIAANGSSVQVDAADTLQADNGVINIDRSSTSWSGPVATDVRVSEQVPAQYGLMQNYPNPFNPTTTIEYRVARAGPVSLTVFNLLGQKITTLVDEVKQPGTYRMKWNAEGIPSGVYFYKLQAGSSFSATKRMLLVK